jgi:chromosome segregation ATPase
MDTPTPTPQEVQELIAKVKALPAADANGHHTLRAAAAALSAYQQEVEQLRGDASRARELSRALDAEEQRANALEHEVERLTKERDDWKLATDQFQGMWSDAEARAAVAKRAAFVEAAQAAKATAETIRNLAGRFAANDGMFELAKVRAEALDSFADYLTAQAVPPGATEDGLSVGTKNA